MEFALTLFVFPFSALCFGIIGQLLLKSPIKVFILSFLGWLVATFAFLNSSFLIWVFVYSALSLIGALGLHYTKKFYIKNKDKEVGGKFGE